MGPEHLKHTHKMLLLSPTSKGRTGEDDDDDEEDEEEEEEEEDEYDGGKSIEKGLEGRVMYIMDISEYIPMKKVKVVRIFNKKTNRTPINPFQH
jgi:hypothetical protein